MLLFAASSIITINTLMRLVPFIFILLSAQCLAQSTKRPLTDTPLIFQPKIIPLTLKPNDTLYLSKIPFAISQAQFSLMLKKPTPIIYWEITVQDKRGNIVKSNNLQNMSHVMDIIRSNGREPYSNPKNHAVIYNLTYLNDSGKKIKLDKTIVILH